MGEKSITSLILDHEIYFNYDNVFCNRRSNNCIEPYKDKQDTMIL